MSAQRDPAAPRLAPELLKAQAVLEDEAAWEGQEISGRFEGTSASHVDVIGCRVTGAALTAVEIDRLRLVDTLLEDCELSGAVFSRSALTRVEFRRCRLSGLVASGARFTDVRFTECKLDDANFRSTAWNRSVLDGCLMMAADFREAKLQATRLDGCDLTGVDFTKAALPGVSLAGSILADIRGADALRGVIITGDQIIPLAIALFSMLGITIDER
jgi:uncharacterized protein YjbI with pentapeptide repeats